MKKILDEREEAEVSKIEHTGFWSLFFGLVVLITIKKIFPECNFINLYGDTVLLFISGWIVIVGYMKAGVWSYKLKPTNLNNIILSIIVAVSVSIVAFLVGMRAFQGDMNKVLVLCVSFGIGEFILAFSVLTVAKRIVLNRKKKLEERYEDEFYEK